jgi:hypothetical protein
MVKIVEVTENKLPFDLATDIKAHMANDKDFYRQEYYPCMCNLQKKVKEDSCTNEDVMPMILKACKSYADKYDVPAKEFTKDIRKQLATDILKDELPRLRKGEY